MSKWNITKQGIKFFDKIDKDEFYLVAMDKNHNKVLQKVDPHLLNNKGELQTKYKYLHKNFIELAIPKFKKLSGTTTVYILEPITW